MQKTLVGVAISILLATPAMAADMRMPVKAPPPAPAPVAYNWTGCYVGAGGGYGMYNQEMRLVDSAALSNDNGGRGWFGTVQVGCDYQIGSNWVIGAFADYDFGNNIKGVLALPTTSYVGEEKLKWSWAAGGRIGWLPFSQLLVFVSGGYTQARFGEVDLIIAELGISSDASIARNTYSGYFIGTGYEYGLGWLPGLFWKTEYRFADYGRDRIPQLGDGTGEFVDSRKYIHTVRSELVWRFNFGGPVVARY